MLLAYFVSWNIGMVFKVFLTNSLSNQRAEQTVDLFIQKGKLYSCVTVHVMCFNICIHVVHTQNKLAICDAIKFPCISRSKHLVSCTLTATSSPVSRLSMTTSTWCASISSSSELLGYFWENADGSDWMSIHLQKIATWVAYLLEEIVSMFTIILSIMRWLSSLMAQISCETCRRGEVNLLTFCCLYLSQLLLTL